MVGKAGSEVTPVGHNTVAHKLHGFVAVEFVDSREAGTNGGQRRRRKCSWINQGGIEVQRAETGVQVVAVGVNQFQGSDGKAHFGHGGGELFDAAAAGTKTVG